MIPPFDTRWDIGRVTPPWGDRPSIYRHVAARIETAGAHGWNDDEQLPDDLFVHPGSRLWSGGAYDGVLGGTPENDERSQNSAEAILAVLCALAQEATDARADAMYALVSKPGALGYVDALLSRLPEYPGLQSERALAIGRWLATEAADREAVKCGIALVAATSPGEARDRELLMTLGRHDEFTLYAVVALQHTEPDPEPLVWELARQVDGWGRVQAIRRLEQTSYPRIKAWLLRDGCLGSLVEPVVLICAQAGDLAGALREPEPDDALMEGAGSLLAALAGRGLGAADMKEYADGHEATSSYLRHLRTREADLAVLHVVAALQQFIERARDRNDDASGPWRGSADLLLAWIQEIKARPDWPAKIRAGLASDEFAPYGCATYAAKAIGLDIWGIHIEGLQRGEDRWAFAARTDDPERLERVVELAEHHLPLQEIASGAADERGFGLGPEFREHNSLGCVLQELPRLPGKGWPLIRTGLFSPLVRNRNAAAQALEAWQRTAWPAEAQPLLRTALAAEPNPRLRKRLGKLLGD